MPPNASGTSFEQANDLVNEYASQYLESFIMFDDCADVAPTKYETPAKALLKEHKTTTRS
ncbi:hypothetical protein BDC45DRAFT_567374 [Circinella umbellata]|nr:hypothetical protein BDC45DRAFT_567374 [Circinella umbellata]